MKKEWKVGQETKDTWRGQTVGTVMREKIQRNSNQIRRVREGKYNENGKE